MIAPAPVLPQDRKARQQRWNAVLYLVALAATIVVLGTQVVHILHQRTVLNRLDAQLNDLRTRQALVPVATPRGPMLRLPGWSCHPTTDGSTAADTVDQDDGPGILSTVHNVQPVVVCPSV